MVEKIKGKYYAVRRCTYMNRYYALGDVCITFPEDPDNDKHLQKHFRFVPEGDPPPFNEEDEPEDVRMVTFKTIQDAPKTTANAHEVDGSALADAKTLTPAKESAAALD